jgi:hypothetical protein
MMKLLDTDGAWIAIGISVFFIVVGVVMKRVFVSVLKNGAPSDALPPNHSPGKIHD